jgi:hypothetical protein
MKVLSHLLFLGIACLFCAAAPQQQGIIPPGQMRANKAVRSGMQLEPPMVRPSAFKSKSIRWATASCRRTCRKT